jgi:biotin-dependent carboxylase-like uncharacterized protein
VIEVLSPGPFTTIQDLGRPGLAAIGVGESGAADRPSLRLANRLVGNEEGAAALELTFGRLVVRFTRTTVIALTGAPCPLHLSTVDDSRAADMYAPISVLAGQELRVGGPTHGMRTYLAVQGGIDVPPVLGARCTDVLSGLGPPRLAAGQRLPIGRGHTGQPFLDIAPQPMHEAAPTLRVVPGPRQDWFTPEALNVLCSAPYEVSADSNRVGLRLTGPVLHRQITAELPPEAMVTGALQIPPSGQPVLFLADHPVTGGYPVIGVVTDDDLPLAAQACPGETLHFRLTP